MRNLTGEYTLILCTCTDDLHVGQHRKNERKVLAAAELDPSFGGISDDVDFTELKRYLEYLDHFLFQYFNLLGHEWTKSDVHEGSCGVDE